MRDREWEAFVDAVARDRILERMGLPNLTEHRAGDLIRRYPDLAPLERIATEFLRLRIPAKDF